MCNECVCKQKLAPIKLLDVMNGPCQNESSHCDVVNVILVFVIPENWLVSKRYSKLLRRKQLSSRKHMSLFV